MLHNQDFSKKCPCGSGKPFNFCCEPALDGHKPAQTAEALMRSRYTAFALGCVDYLIKTTAEEHRNEDDAEVLKEQIQATTWLGLEIVDTNNGQADDEHGTVEFIAHFESDDHQASLHEISRFRKQQHHWYYVDGDVEISG